MVLTLAALCSVAKCAAFGTSGVCLQEARKLGEMACSRTANCSRRPRRRARCFGGGRVAAAASRGQVARSTISVRTRTHCAHQQRRETIRGSNIVVTAGDDWRRHGLGVELVAQPDSRETCSRCFRRWYSCNKWK